MSLVLSGPRRIYVLLLVWQRLEEACAGCPRSLGLMHEALGGDDPARVVQGCRPLCRVVLSLRLHRTLWRRLVGLTLVVMEA